MNNSIGRCTRTALFTRVIFASVISFILGYIQGTTEKRDIIILFSYVITLLLYIYIIVWSLKRMHDVNKSGWYLFVPIYNIILLFTPGTKGSNDYGEDPRTSKVTEDDTFINIISSLLMASFFACASYALMSETHIVDSFQYSEVIKNTIFISFFVVSFIFFLVISLRKEDKNSKETSPQ